MINKLFFTLIAVFAISCSDQNKKAELFDHEINMIKKKTELVISDIKLKGNQFPNRYLKIRSHSAALNNSIDALKSILSKKNEKEYRRKIKSLKKVITESNLYRGSAIFDLIDERFNFLNQEKINDYKVIKWNLLNLEYELQNYLYKHLHDDYLTFKTVNPIIVDDSFIYLVSTDSTVYQKIMIWDINKADTLFYNKNKVTEINLKNGRGLIDESIQKKFPEGFQGVFKVGTNRGDINYYHFKSK